MLNVSDKNRLVIVCGDFIAATGNSDKKISCIESLPLRKPIAYKTST